jgi:hypothetical protein
MFCTLTATKFMGHAKQASVDRRRCLWINLTQTFFVNTLTSDCNPIS